MNNIPKEAIESISVTIDILNENYGVEILFLDTTWWKLRGLNIKKRKETELIINESEAEIVRMIFNLGNDIKGDIDLLMIKSKYIFCCQIKNREITIDVRVCISFDIKINNKTLSQLNFANEFISSNPKYLTEFFNITDLNVFLL